MSLGRLVLVLVFGVVGSAVRADAQVLSLALVSTHTGEQVSVVFKRNGSYVPEAVERLERFLRDHRNGDRHAIDPMLFDILHEIQRRAGVDVPFQLISGYRSPKTNEMLRRTTTGVAKASMHTMGRAIDVRLPGVDTRVLRDIALALRAGGVGYYEDSNFIHVDTGRIRRW